MRLIYSLMLVLLVQNLFSQNLNSKDFQDMVEAESKSFHKGIINKGVPQAVNYDLKYHRLEWQIDPEVYYITGAVTSYFEPVVAGFSEMYFDFSNALIIDSIVYHGTNLSYTQPVGDVLQITLPSVLPQNVLDSVTVYYQGAPVASSGFGSFIQSSHNNDSIIWTLSEPYGALEWWPCKQDLNDKIDSIDVIVTTPSQNRVGSQGLLVSETTVGSNKIYHWKHRYPIAAYLISVAITNYAAFTNNASLSQGNLDILNYVYPEDSLGIYGQSLAIIPIIEMYDSLFGTYPFMNEKYGHAQFGWGGGMEHQTMSSVVNFNQPLIAHELAHQWFGDKVTCGSWSEIWLNEGFATYLTGLVFKNFIPTWWYAWRSGTIYDVTQLPDGSVFCTDTTDVNRIFNGRLSYKKGSYLLRMLEWKLGQPTFFQGIRNYLDDVNNAYAYSTTANFQSHLETVSGLNLTEFFNDWYYGEGYPSYQVQWAQNGNNVTFTINQTQSHSSVLFYEMPVPIYAKGQGFDTTYVFDHQFSGQTFNVTVPFTIDSVFFDPELWILSANSTVIAVDEISDIQNRVDVYPNPCKKYFQIKTSKKERIDKVSIFNGLGQLVFPKIIEKSSHFYKLDTQHLSKGNYIIEIKINDLLIRKQLSKI